MKKAFPRKVSRAEAKAIGDRLGVRWDLFDLGQLRAGLEVEQEHPLVTGGDMMMVAMIALDHLTEMPDYYTRLHKMEAAAERKQSSKAKSATARSRLSKITSADRKGHRSAR